MKNILQNKVYFLLAFLLFDLNIKGGAQTISENKLFDSDELLQITLQGDLRPVLNDRSGKPQKHPASLSLLMDEKKISGFPVQLQARGNFRRKKENCNYPPLWIHFPETGEKQNSIFSNQHKTKLVMPCLSDEYVIREWLVYKLYNLLTPLSFRARLVKVKLENPKIKKVFETFYALLLEEEKQLAARNNLLAIERKIKPEETETDHFLLMAVFEYFIGNTDWSVQYLHNVKLLAKNETDIPLTVPYDFDHAGIVNAPYAMPAEALQLRSVQERRFRGYCINDFNKFDKVIERFNSLKKDIYNVYNSCKLLDPKYLKKTLQFLDEFYLTINNQKDWQKEFRYPCDPNGTGNIVIKGLKEN